MNTPSLPYSMLLAHAYSIRTEFRLTNSNGWLTDAYTKRLADECGPIFETRQEIYIFLFQEPFRVRIDPWDEWMKSFVEEDGADQTKTYYREAAALQKDKTDPLYASLNIKPFKDLEADSLMDWARLRKSLDPSERTYTAYFGPELLYIYFKGIWPKVEEEVAGKTKTYTYYRAAAELQRDKTNPLYASLNIKPFKDLEANVAIDWARLRSSLDPSERTYTGCIGPELLYIHFNGIWPKKVPFAFRMQLFLRRFSQPRRYLKRASTKFKGLLFR